MSKTMLVPHIASMPLPSPLCMIITEFLLPDPLAFAEAVLRPMTADEDDYRGDWLIEYDGIYLTIIHPGMYGEWDENGEYIADNYKNVIEPEDLDDLLKLAIAVFEFEDRITIGELPGQLADLIEYRFRTLGTKFIFNIS